MPTFLRCLLGAPRKVASRMTSPLWRSTFLTGWVGDFSSQPHAAFCLLLPALSSDYTLVFLVVLGHVLIHIYDAARKFAAACCVSLPTRPTDHEVRQSWTTSPMKHGRTIPFRSRSITIRSVDERLGQLTPISHMIQAPNHGFGASKRLGYKSIPGDGWPGSCIIL
jgi:hypothetical protein